MRFQAVCRIKIIKCYFLFFQKIGRVKLKEIFPIETIQQLVTTSSADKTHIAAIEAAGLPVTLVAETPSEA